MKTPIYITLLIILTLSTTAMAQPEFFSVIPNTTEPIKNDESVHFYSTGLLIPEHLRGTQYVVSDNAEHELTSKWDWRKHNGVTPVKDQGKCGSCYAFGAVGMVESGIKVYDGITYDLSEEQAKSCMWEIGGCAGGTVQWVMNPFTQNGIILEKDYPYSPTNGICYPFEPTLRLTDWHLISTDASPSRNQIKSYIKQAPVVTSLTVSGWERGYNGSYVLDTPDKEGKDHAVILVGWNDSISDENVSGHWIFKNSWGTGWGDNGYGYIEYDTAKIGTHMSILGGYEDYDPYTRTLNYDEAGWNGAFGAHGFDTIKCMARFNISTEEINGIEFWTTGVTSDIDLYLYDGFNDKKVNQYYIGNLTNELYSIENLSYPEPGYHSVSIDEKIVSTTGTVVVVASIKNIDCIYFNDKVAPIAVDNQGNTEYEKTFVSVGDPNSKWYGWWYDTRTLPMHDGSIGKADVALRLRISDGNPEYKNITISTTDPTENVSVGDTVNFTAVCIDNNDDEIYCGKITWFNDNATVGTLECSISSSTFTSLFEGNTTVYAKGNKTSNSIPISVIPAEPVCDYIILCTEDYTTDIYINDTIELTYTCLDQYADNIECGNVTWFNDNESVGVMNGITFIGLSEGVTNITIISNCTHSYSNSVQMNVIHKPIIVVTPEPTAVPTVKSRSRSSSSSTWVIPTSTSTPVPTVESTPLAEFIPKIIVKSEINITTDTEPNNTTIPQATTPTNALVLFIICAFIIGVFLIYKSNKG